MVLNFELSVKMLQQRGMTTERYLELARAYEIDQSIIVTAYKLGLLRNTTD